MSKDNELVQEKPPKDRRTWRLAFVVGMVAFAAIVVYDAYELLHGRNVSSKQSSFGKCAICHSLEPLKHGIGPSLHCVIGRRMGSHVGYRYSSAMAHAGREGGDTHWNRYNLAGYIVDPHGIIEGTRMPFPGFQEDVEPLVDYIQSKCEFNAIVGNHQLVSISRDEGQAFKRCDVVLETASRAQCEVQLRDIIASDQMGVSRQPLRVCIPAGSLSC